MRVHTHVAHRHELPDSSPWQVSKGSAEGMSFARAWPRCASISFLVDSRHSVERQAPFAGPNSHPPRSPHHDPFGSFAHAVHMYRIAVWHGIIHIRRFACGRRLGIAQMVRGTRGVDGRATARGHPQGIVPSVPLLCRFSLRAPAQRREKSVYR